MKPNQGLPILGQSAPAGALAVPSSAAVPHPGTPLAILGAADGNAGGCCGGSSGGGGGCGCSSSPAASPVEKPIYWRSLSELRGEESFETEFLHREFPVAASEFPEGISRRKWMTLMGASMALVGASAGCRYPEEAILPFVIRPEGRVPGEAYYRATNYELAGRVYNLLVKIIDGRPLKIEPNDKHPLGGGTDPFSQASILTLYDPDRSRAEDDNVILLKGENRRGSTTWEDFLGFSRVLINTLAKKDQGASFAVLCPPTSSPSVVRMIGQLKQRLPGAKVCRFESVDGDATAEATTRLFGSPARQVLKLEEADVVVTIQADILGLDKGMVTTSAGFAKRRDPIHGDMNRLYVVEGGYSSTGAAADTRLALQPSQMPAFLAALQRRVDSAGDHSHDDDPATEVAYDEMDHAGRLETFLDVLAHDIADAGDRAVVVVGDALGADAVAAGIRMNASLGSLGKSQQFLPTVDGDLSSQMSLAELTDSIDDGVTKSLLILGDNPVFTAPGNVALAAAIGSLEHSMYLGEYDDETAALCDYSAPMSHPLESWGDVVDDSGYHGICQPQILPLLGGRSTIEVLAAMLGEEETDGESIVRRTADQAFGGVSDRAWRNLLHDGFSEDFRTDYISTGSVAVGGEDLTDAPLQAIAEVDRDNMEVLFVPADGLYDGRFANNAWLQELPQALTAMCWDNAAIMSPRTAKALGVKHGLKVALETPDGKIELPVYEIPGCAPGVVQVAIGYGRTRAGKVGGYVEYDVDVVGIDVSPLRTTGNRLIAYNVTGRPRFNEYDIATTQNHWAIDELGREEAESRSYELVREGTTALLDKLPEFTEALGPHVPSVGATGSPWREPINEIEEETAKNKRSGKGPEFSQWGMAIDMTKCTGCNACVIACQSENNVPVVGREQVMKSREMHWLRLDRYFQGDEENADIVQQPVACMHCETAPCEQVCPVAATVHTNEGINAMAYNRCIGTRYCANNCPFKVRRFNYFNYNEEVGTGYGWNAFPGHIEKAERRLESLQLNPEVTVRGRGVMEKCTYCTQRVEAAKIDARRNHNGVVPEGAVQTACQTACPTKAIEFGNVADPDSAVSKKHADVRSYGMLSQLNVKPRTEYLARVRNTPLRLMTRNQLTYLAELQAPHHGSHGDHGEHDTHGHDSHGTEGHGHDGHGHDEHDHGDHDDHDHVHAESHTT